MEELVEDLYELSFRSLISGIVESVNIFTSWLKLTPIPTLLMAYTTLMNVSDQHRVNLVDVVGEELAKDIMPIKQPIDETIVEIGSSHCAQIQKLLGVAYEQLEGVSEPDLDALTFTYKTRNTSVVYNTSVVVNAFARARAFDPNQKLIIFVHGFTDDPTKESFTNISEAFLRNGYNSILALDGSPLIRWLYIRATTYVRFMGRKMGEVLANMVANGTDPASIHMIGHSLGSHISGFAGKTFTKLTGQRVGRISALDPAGPCFSHVAKKFRLHYTDADFVDAIHTDSGVFGLKEAVGHVDYYPNGGSQQPNCLLQACSHTRSWSYFTESVEDIYAFPAVQCKDWETFKQGECGNEISYMGIASKPGTKGLFFLQTRGVFPFGLRRDGLKYRDQQSLLQVFKEILG